MSESRKCTCQGTAADEEAPREDTAAPESEIDEVQGLSYERMMEYQRGLLLSGVLESAKELRVVRNTLFDKGTPSHNQIQTDILFNIQALMVFLVERYRPPARWGQ